MSTSKPLRVMLVEDHIAYRQAIAFLMSLESGIEVVAQAGSLAQAREALLAEVRLDVVVLDLALPDGDGSELIGELRQSNPGVSVVVLSAAPGRGDLRQVDAVLDKAESPLAIAKEVGRLGRSG